MIKNRKILLNIGVFLILSTFISSCAQTTTTTLTGAAVKGPINSGTVTVYILNDDGSRGDILAITTTEADGTYSVELENYNGAVSISVTGGSYLDEATGERVSLEAGFELETLLASTNDGQSVSITALTTIAASRASFNISAGLESAINDANEEVATAFGLSIKDLSSVIPSDMNSDTSLDSDLQKAYGAVQSGLCELIKSKELLASDVLTLIDTMAQDFEDGDFDGENGHGNKIISDLSVTPAEALTGLKNAIDKFISGIEIDLEITIPSISFN